LFGYACFTVCVAYIYVLGLLSGLFWLFLRQGLPFLVNLVACRRLAVGAGSC